MKPTILVVSAALALGLLAGCDRKPEERTTATPQSGSAAGGTTAQPQSNTPSTPANVGQPQSQAEKKHGANPVQQQVDPKEGAQHRDFQHKGDGAGPRSSDTAPKTGG